MTVDQKAADEAAATRMRCLELALALYHGQPAAYPIVLAVAEHFARYVAWGTVPPLPPLPGAPS